MIALFAGGLIAAWAFDVVRRGDSDGIAKAKPAPVASAVPARPSGASPAPSSEADDLASLRWDEPEGGQPKLVEPAKAERESAAPPADRRAPEPSPPVSYEARMREQMLRVAATPDAIPTEEEREAFVRYMEEKMAEVAEQDARNEAAKRAAEANPNDYRGRDAYERYLGIQPVPEVTEDPQLGLDGPGSVRITAEPGDPGQSEGSGENELLD